MYYSIIDGFSILFSFVFARYAWYRLRFFVHVFQQVGYKHNEYWHWLRANWEKKVIPGDLALYNILLFVIVLGLEWIELSVTNTATAIALFIWGFYWFGSVSRYKPKNVKKPLVFTARVKRLMIPVGLFNIFFPFFFGFWAYTGMVPFLWVYTPSYNPGFLSFDVVLLIFGWVVGAIFIPFTIVWASRITRPIEKYIQYKFKKQARAKLESMPHLKVIAITGSYGKTSTKFMLRDLLKERFAVCATPGSFNTPMGICKVINNDLQAHHQVLILEMGARYPGNIQELCDIARPDIAVVTNVGVAHLETFGSQEVIAHEKATLVDNVKPGGLAVLNADDPFVAAMGIDRTDISRMLVGLEQGELIATNINYDTSGTQFSLRIENETHRFQTRLLGAHNVQNLLLALGVAHSMNIRPSTMEVAARGILPIEHRLELKQAGDFFVIDDAFNSNPIGARNAVEILAQFKNCRRIIITPGMIELGELEFEENKNFGKTIGEAKLDLVILVGKERSKPILEGIREIQPETAHVTVVDSLHQANEIARKYIQPGDVILYENDLPDVYNE